MTPPRSRTPRPPLNRGKLDELALYYVGRFATTRAKLAAYLQRKVRERGWAGDGDPDFDALVDRFARSGLVDDRAFALAKAQAMTRRGYGSHRLSIALRSAGVEESDAAPAYDHARQEKVGAALRFAERRRIGPFAQSLAKDPSERQKQRQRQIAAMVRAGHPLGLSLAILRLEPGADIDLQDLDCD